MPLNSRGFRNAWLAQKPSKQMVSRKHEPTLPPLLPIYVDRMVRKTHHASLGGPLCLIITKPSDSLKFCLGLRITMRRPLASFKCQDAMCRTNLSMDYDHPRVPGALSFQFCVTKNDSKCSQGPGISRHPSSMQPSYRDIPSKAARQRRRTI